MTFSYNLLRVTPSHAPNLHSPYNQQHVQATLEAAVSVAVSGKATSEEARAAVEAELTRVQGHLLLDRSLSSDMQLSILNAELQKLQPYGAPAATASTTAGTGRGASMQRPTTAARFEETAKAQVMRDKSAMQGVRAHARARCGRCSRIARDPSFP